MSDLDRIPALMREIGMESVGAWKYMAPTVILSVDSRDGSMTLHVINADRDVYAAVPSGGPTQVIHDNYTATLRFGHVDGEDLIARLERALAFVRTEAPVPC
ncbi:hypothetical protein [Gordonia malaquae]|uniref:hypothetical protein n=1 Tax=Gordonia malaquae TaxID=410332 RepID=UPI0030FEBA5A